MSDIKEFTDCVCPFCGSLCDDIVIRVNDQNEIVEVENACTIGTRKFFSSNDEKERVLTPLIRKDGKLVETDLETAINEAAKILANADYPLLYGFSSTEAGAQAVGVELAEEVGGNLDNTASVCHGPTILAEQDVGVSGATLGEIKARADIIVYVGSNPTHAHPRHLSRYSTFIRGYFREKGVMERRLIVIDPRYTDTAKLATDFIQVEQGKDFELFSAMRAVLKGTDIPDEVAGIKKEKIKEIVEIMKNAQFGVVFFGMGLTQSIGKHRNIDAAIFLVKDLNSYTKWIIAPMRGHWNVSGANTVFTWQTGYPYSINFSRGYPRYNPGEYSANDVLLREEADAALIVASDPVSNFPKKACEWLGKIPLIVIDPHKSPTTEIADVVIPAAIVGIETEGTGYRMDSVPIRLHKVKNPPNENILTDKEILEKILEKVRELKK
ncbi:MAG: formylmethanofuran dehydrogenase subunit B [Candidatus Helarchaeota archaeon]